MVLTIVRTNHAKAHRRFGIFYTQGNGIHRDEAIMRPGLQLVRHARASHDEDQARAEYKKTSVL